MKADAKGFTQAFPAKLGEYDCDAKNAPTVTP
jgi:hypothetical protein